MFTVPNGVSQHGTIRNSDFLLQLPLDSPGDREATRQRVDELIISLEKDLLELRGYRNRIASISLLPDEVLSKIFYQFVLSTDPWSGAWTKILLVCRRWADVAMGDGRLWAFITEDDGDVLPRAQTWANRSKGHPLGCKFDLSNTYPYSNAFNQHVFLDNVHRIRTLEVEANKADITQFFQGVHDLPVIEDLRIDLSDECDEDGTDYVAWSVPAFLFEGRTERLRSLHLIESGLSSPDHWKSLVNLTHLSLERSGFMTVAALPSLSGMADILRASPQLRTLSLQCYIDESEESTRAISPVTLSFLEILRIDQRVLDIACILNYLIIPPTTAMSLAARGVNSASSGLCALLMPIRRHLRREGAIVLRSLRLKCHVLGSFSFSASSGCECPSQSNDSEALLPLPHFSLITHPKKQSDFRRILIKIMHAVPFHPQSDGAISVTASGIYKRDSHLSPCSWMTVFDLLAVPVKVKIGVNEGMVSMFGGLLAAMQKSRRQKKKRSHLPSTLKLSTLHLLAARHAGRMSSRDGQRELYDNLMDLLIEYQDLHVVSKSQGTPVDTLIVTDIKKGFLHVFRMLDHLRELSGVLMVDGLVVPKSPEPADEQNVQVLTGEDKTSVVASA